MQSGSDEPFVRVGAAEARTLIEKGIQVVDVREPQEYAEVRIPGSTLVPLGTLLQSPREFLKDRAILFLCSEGIRSAIACEAAAAIGLEEVYNLEAGIEGWRAGGYPVEAVEGADPIVTTSAAASPSSPADFLVAGERLIRIHRFRYLRAAGCAVSTLDLVVEESLGEARDPFKRCVARPDHPERVPVAELTMYGESVEAALRTLIETLRGRRPHEIFLPTA